MVVREEQVNEAVKNSRQRAASEGHQRALLHQVGPVEEVSAVVQAREQHAQDGQLDNDAGGDDQNGDDPVAPR